MNYWEGLMDWPIERDWICETCKQPSYLIWGLAHGRCRCDICHTEYNMRDTDKVRVTKPISALNEEYKKPAQIGYELFKKPLTKWTDAMWDEAIAEAQKEGM